VAVLPQLSGHPMVTDGGLETDLIYHHGVDLPEFAAFPLVDDARGRELLLHYYDAYVGIARRAGAGLQLETATWRTSRDWGDRLGYPAAELQRVNRDAVAMLVQLRDRAGLDRLLVSGCLGPRGDGYVPARTVMRRSDPPAETSFGVVSAHTSRDGPRASPATRPTSPSPSSRMSNATRC
jgi:homocysteine S-methyltransferase